MIRDTFPLTVDPNALHDALNSRISGFRVLSGVSVYNGYPTEALLSGRVYSTDTDIIILRPEGITKDEIIEVIEDLAGT